MTTRTTLKVAVTIMLLVLTIVSKAYTKDPTLCSEMKATWDPITREFTVSNLKPDIKEPYCIWVTDPMWAEGTYDFYITTFNGITPGATTYKTGRLSTKWGDPLKGGTNGSSELLVSIQSVANDSQRLKGDDCNKTFSAIDIRGGCEGVTPTYCNNFNATFNGSIIKVSGINNCSNDNLFLIAPAHFSKWQVVSIVPDPSDIDKGSADVAALQFYQTTEKVYPYADGLMFFMNSDDKNSGKTGRGPNYCSKSFDCITDTQAPNPPSGLQSSSIGPTGFTISWTASFDNVGVTAYDIYVNGKLHTNSTSTSKVLTGLTLGTSYIINIKARDASGNTSISSKALEVTTSTTDPQAPTTPSNLTATFASDLSVTVKWNKSTSIHGINWYDVYKDGAWYANTTDTTISITGLQVAATYSITIKAKDNAGKSSALSNELQVTTKKESQPPTKPSGVMNTEPTQNSFTVSWTASSDNIAVTEYRVYLNGIPYGSSPSNVQLLVNLNPATTYTVTVSAFDAAGNESLKSDPIIVNTLATNIQNIGHSKLNIFPNPFKDVLNIANNGFTKYYIYDMNNILLASGEITSNQLSLSQLTSGMYILKLSDENNSIYTKIIKE